MAEKTRTKKNDYQWNEHGLFLTSMELSFFANASPGMWAQLITKLNLDLEEAPTTSPPTFSAASFAALPIDVKKDDLYLTGHVHPAPGVEQPGECAHWHLRWDRAPASKPPRRLIEQSQKHGGYSSFLQALSEAWPDSNESTVRIEASYVAQSLPLIPAITQLSRRIKPISVQSDGLSFDLSPVVSIVTWEVKPDSGPIQRLSVSPLRKKIFVLTVEGEQRFRLSTSIFNDVDNHIWVGLQPFLRATVVGS